MVHGLMGLLAAWSASWLSRRWGKQRTPIVGEALAIVGVLSTWVFYDPAHPWWQLVPWSLICIGPACLWILASLMLADVCDVDEIHCGMKRAGMFGAMFALLFKAGSGLAMFLGGLMLTVIGFDEKAAI